LFLESIKVIALFGTCQLEINIKKKSRKFSLPKKKVRKQPTILFSQLYYEEFL